MTVHHGDARELLKTLPDSSVDSCVTDPPYALVSIVKRFGQPGSADLKKAGRPKGEQDPYMRASAGFMGQKWDVGDTAHDPAFWREVYRVLKPGAHLVAFAGTRTYHRLACAIEDAGFEIRDMVAWLYGSGFPKSHDVAKGIDRSLGATGKHVARGSAVKRMIPGAELVTPPGGTVLDPFAGTGTTGLAAKVEGFGAILIEREADYVDMIRQRLAWAANAHHKTTGQLVAERKKQEPLGGLFAGLESRP